MITQNAVIRGGSIDVDAGLKEYNGCRFDGIRFHDITGISFDGCDFWYCLFPGPEYRRGASLTHCRLYACGGLQAPAVELNHCVEHPAICMVCENVTDRMSSGEECLNVMHLMSSGEGLLKVMHWVCPECNRATLLPSEAR